MRTQLKPELSVGVSDFMVICVYEDRKPALIAVRLLVLSLRRNCPDVPIVVSCPLSDPSFTGWVRSQRGVVLHEDPSLRGLTWNIKPTMLLHLLDAGHEEVVWIDSDTILARDFRFLLSDCRSEEVVVTEAQYWDVYQGGTVRTELWGLEPGRALPTLACTGFVRITAAHRDLLRAWQRLLADEEYGQAQQRAMYKRPIHMIGDQDVFSAILEL